MRYRSESRYTGAVANLFSPTRAPIVTPPFYRGSFVSGGACKTNVSPFLSRPFVCSPRSPLSTYLLTYLLTFHARKPDVYYRACLAISVLSPFFPLSGPLVREERARTRGSTPQTSVRGYSSLSCFAPRIINVVIAPRWKRCDAVQTSAVIQYDRIRG